MITVRQVVERQPHETEGRILFIADGPDGHEALLARTTPEAAAADGLAYFKATRVEIDGKWTIRTKPYDVQPARYSKGNNLIRPVPTGNGTKSRAERLLCALRCRYTNRERGYVATPSKTVRFEKLFADGWDANFFSNELQAPEVKP